MTLNLLYECPKLSATASLRKLQKCYVSRKDCSPKIFSMCSLKSSWLLILRVKTFDKLFHVLHAWCVNVLSGVPFLWVGRVGKEAGCLQDGQYQLATQLGKPLKVLTEPENKLGWCKNKCLVLKTFFSWEVDDPVMNISSTNSWWSWPRKQHPPNVYFYFSLSLKADQMFNTPAFV